MVAEGDASETDPLVFVMKSAFLGKPILRVYHEADGDWQYLTEDAPEPKAAKMVHQSHVTALDPALASVKGLVPGTWAERADAASEWVVAIDDDDQTDEFLVYVTQAALAGEPVVRVFHERGGDWQYITDGPLFLADARMVHQAHIHDLYPTLDEVLSMPEGKWAERSSPQDAWVVRDDV